MSPAWNGSGGSGGVGGTEIYLRELLVALGAIDQTNQYFVFANLETGPDLVPRQANFHFWRWTGFCSPAWDARPCSHPPT